MKQPCREGREGNCVENIQFPETVEASRVMDKLQGSRQKRRHEKSCGCVRYSDGEKATPVYTSFSEGTG